jgi:hypothetical protein
LQDRIVGRAGLIEDDNFAANKDAAESGSHLVSDKPI